MFESGLFFAKITNFRPFLLVLNFLNNIHE